MVAVFYMKLRIGWEPMVEGPVNRVVVHLAVLETGWKMATEVGEVGDENDAETVRL